MGVGNIIENNIANGCQSVWKKVPQISQIPIDISKYNKAFVNFVSLVGVYALFKSSVFLVKKSIQFAKSNPKIPTAIQMQEKYGDHSWILVVDCKGNQQYCILLAQRGFNLILCGQQDDIKIAEDRLIRQSGELDFKIQTFIVNWQEQAKKLSFYQELQQKLKDFDISMMIMPMIQVQRSNSTHQQVSPFFQHIYLMARQFGPKLKWRSHASAIIIPSSQIVDKVNDDKNGVTRAVQSGVDAFGRALGFQLRKTLDILVARGSAQNALANLGKNRISH